MKFDIYYHKQDISMELFLEDSLYHQTSLVDTWKMMYKMSEEIQISSKSLLIVLATWIVELLKSSSLWWVVLFS